MGGVAVVVAALLLARSISLAVPPPADGLSDVALHWRFSLFGFAQLLLMTAPILIAITVVSQRGPAHGAARVLALTLTVVLSSLVGVLARLAFMWAVNEYPSAGSLPGFLATVWPRYALLAGLLTLALETGRRALEASDLARRSMVDSEALQIELASSTLQALQARIEPHFLFNTLAHVRHLCDTDLTHGRTMIDSLRRYLEIALPQLREPQVALGSDAELVQAYLQIHQIRMGRRLRFEIDLPEALKTQPVPPLMLLTLIENAVKHGIQPSREGGLIRLSASIDQGALCLRVADSGVGFAAGSGSGTGLANIRARLAAQFGAAARLELQNNDLGGATACLWLPLPVARR